MATNEKAVYATQYTTHGGVLYKPGDRLDERMPEHAVKGAQEQGLTGNHADAERAAAAEQERRERVANEIETRSEKRQGSMPHQGQRVIQMPDGSFRLVE